MAAKGSIAKENLISKIIKSLPNESYIGCYDKKWYFWSEENGEKVQIALTLTVPKNPVVPVSLPVDNGMDFSGGSQYLATVGSPQGQSQEITAEELSNIQELMNKLGL